MFCERCGLNFLPKQSVCTRCNASATRHWFQLMSLVTLLLAVCCNTLVAFLLLPRLNSAVHPHFIFRAWMWFDRQMGLYGWVPLAMALLAWDLLVWKEARPKIKGWLTRKLLTISLAAGIAPILPWWLPAGQPPGTPPHTRPLEPLERRRVILAQVLGRPEHDRHPRRRPPGDLEPGHNVRLLPAVNHIPAVAE